MSKRDHVGRLDPQPPQPHLVTALELNICSAKDLANGWLLPSVLFDRSALFARIGSSKLDEHRFVSLFTNRDCHKNSAINFRWCLRPQVPGDGSGHVCFGRLLQNRFGHLAGGFSGFG